MALEDEILVHQTFLLRFGNSLASRYQRIFDRIETGSRRIVRESEVNGRWRAQRVRRLEERIRRYYASDETLRGMRDDLFRDLRSLVDRELGWNVEAFEGAQDAEVATPTTGSVMAAASQKPIVRQLPRQWWGDWSSDHVRRVTSGVRLGVIEGQTNNEIVGRIWGQISQDFEGGEAAISRRNLRSLVQTYTNHYSTAARQAVYAENDDIVESIQYVATLDSRTTPICRSLDGERFPPDEGPRPPQHFNCRSTTVPILVGEGEISGRRPAIRPATAEEQARMRRMPTAERRAFLRSQGIVSQVNASTTYQTWLGRQPASVQDAILGPSRGALFRRGDVTLDRFVAPDGDNLTLAQLYQREREAWNRAGLSAPRAA